MRLHRGAVQKSGRIDHMEDLVVSKTQQHADYGTAVFKL